MLDSIVYNRLKMPAEKAAKIITKIGVSANQLTVFGFLVGLGVIPAMLFQRHWIALALVILNRLLDGLDGAVARVTQSTDSGGFLDITLDFIFYSAVVFSFVLYDMENNSLYAALLLFSFMGTASSFLAFAVLAEKRQIKNIIYPHKALYYIGGITEGTETIIFFILICGVPDLFVPASLVFSSLCWITTIFRVLFGYFSLK